MINKRVWNAVAAAAKSLQSWPTLCDPIDGSPLGSSVPEILQARILEWVAISFPNAWKWKVKVKSLSLAWLLATPWTAVYQAPLSMGFSRQEYWSGLPLLSPMQESEKWKWSHSVVPDPQQPHGLQPTRLLRPWDFPGRNTGVGCHCLLPWNAVLGCNLENDRMISVRFQGKPFNITVIQVYAPTSMAEEAEVERFYEDLQDLLELRPKKMSFSL